MIRRLFVASFGVLLCLNASADLTSVDLTKKLCAAEEFYELSTLLQNTELSDSTRADVIECRLDRDAPGHFEITKALAVDGGGAVVDRGTLDSYYYDNVEYVCDIWNQGRNSDKEKFIKGCLVDDLCGFEYDINRGLRFVLDMTAFLWTGEDEAVCALKHVAKYGKDKQQKQELLEYANAKAKIYNNANFLLIIEQLEQLIQNIE